MPLQRAPYDDAEYNLAPRNQRKELSKDRVHLGYGRSNGVLINMKLAKDAESDLREHEPKAKGRESAVHSVVESTPSMVMTKLEASKGD